MKYQDNMAEKTNRTERYIEDWAIKKQAVLSGKLTLVELVTDFYLKVHRSRRLDWMGIVTGIDEMQHNSFQVYLSEHQDPMVVGSSRYGWTTVPVVDAFTLLAIALEDRSVHAEIYRVPAPACSHSDLEARLKIMSEYQGLTLAFTESLGIS